MTDRTTNPGVRSWAPVPTGSDFPIQNLPFGIFRGPDGSGRIGVAIGDHILDLVAVHESGVIRLTHEEAIANSLNSLLAVSGRLASIRRRVSELLTDGNDELDTVAGRGLVPRDSVEMLLPIEVADYVDFYSSEHHASNIGRMFRPDAEPLLPNWKHLPIGYHGRSSTIVVSGTDVARPSGQSKPPDGQPIFGRSTRLDLELEVGFVTGPATSQGEPLSVGTAEQHIAGMLLVNDWSARDLQAWEYVPLGPFVGKSFATTISPWLETLEALVPYRVPAPPQEPEPLPYASGTVSGPDPGTFGSLIELSWNGAEPVPIGGGATRTFLEDGDTVVLRGVCDNGQVRIGFGECAGTVGSATAMKGEPD